MKNRALSIAVTSALLVACGESTPDFPLQTRYVLTWSCTGDCSIPFPYTGYEQMVLRGGDGAFEAHFLGESCTAVTSCQLETGPCVSVPGDAVERLDCSSLAACGVEGESLPGLVLCSSTQEGMEAEPIEVADPDSGDQARYDLHVRVWR